MSKLYLTDITDYEIMDGADDDGIFSVRISKKFPGWEYRVMDFISYENSHNRHPEVNTSEADYLRAKSIYGKSGINDRFLRNHEQNVLIHSTTPENWLSIKESGVLKSWSVAVNEGYINETKPIGSKLCDPLDYRNYVMLGKFGPAGEIVVASKQKGKLSFDINQDYIPGSRIYLDADKLAKDGLLIRDGIHVKVFEKLYLKKYLLMNITPDMLDNPVGNWTPSSFSVAADKLLINEINDEKE